MLSISAQRHLCSETPPHSTHGSLVPTCTFKVRPLPFSAQIFLLLRNKKEQGAESTSCSDSRLKKENKILENSREVFSITALRNKFTSDLGAWKPTWSIICSDYNNIYDPYNMPKHQAGEVAQLV